MVSKCKENRSELMEALAPMIFLGLITVMVIPMATVLIYDSISDMWLFAFIVPLVGIFFFLRWYINKIFSLKHDWKRMDKPIIEYSDNGHPTRIVYNVECVKCGEKGLLGKRVH